MSDKTQILRKTLSANIKKQRENAGLTQEKLAEKAGISANMINDIEGYRSWINDKTLVKLSTALQTETYSQFMPLNLTVNDLAKAATADLAHDLSKIRKDLNTIFIYNLKSRRIRADNLTNSDYN